MLGIREMVLRVPGGSEQDGHVLAEDVVRRVADGLPAQGGSRGLGALRLRVAAPSDSTGSQMTTIVAKAILGGLT